MILNFKTTIHKSTNGFDALFLTRDKMSLYSRFRAFMYSGEYANYRSSIPIVRNFDNSIHPDMSDSSYLIHANNPSNLCQIIEV